MAREKIYFVLLGIVLGVFEFIDTLLRVSTVYSDSQTIAALLSGLVVFCVVFFLAYWTRRFTVAVAEKRLPPDRVKSFLRLDLFSYLIFLFYVANAFGFRVEWRLAVLIVLVQWIFKAAFFGLTMANLGTRSGHSSRYTVAVAFLLSGFAALTYQIVWERRLFTVFGIDIESVTLIVSLFMLGLGLGALGGAWISRRYKNDLVLFFCACEFAIGLFGLFSLRLIDWISLSVSASGYLTRGVAIFGLLFLPTFLMGASLPILAEWFERDGGQSQKWLPRLYGVNMVGAALGCFLAICGLLPLFGMRGAAYFAALVNFSVAALMFQVPRIKSLEKRIKKANEPELGKMERSFSISWILILAFGTGFLFLSQEILWVRVISYATGGRPYSFPFILGFYLLGASAGTFILPKLQRQFSLRPNQIVLISLLASSIFFFLSIPFIGLCYSVGEWCGQIFGFGLIAGLSLVSGGVFPYLCALGMNQTRRMGAGYAVGVISVFNILGSVAGPLITGFFVLDKMGIEKAVLLQVLLAFIVCLPLAQRRWIALGGLAILFASLVTLSPQLYSSLFERLQFKNEYRYPEKFKHLIQNRSGVVGIWAEKSPSGSIDTVYGGGVYDGKFNLDPEVNSNGIQRAYYLAALRPRSEKILSIGFGAGSWARVVADYSPLKELVLVEINPGYFEIVESHPEVASVLKDPKVKSVVDDGRRWLSNHPNEKFDVILTNTTFHWKAYSTNLLSLEFMRLCRSRLNSGGMLYFNATGFEGAKATAAAVFRYVTTFHNFIAASDAPFDSSVEDRMQALLRFNRNGRPVFDPDNDRLIRLAKSMAETRTPDLRENILRGGYPVTTDDNLLPEFKITQKFFEARNAWWNLKSQASAKRKDRFENEQFHE